ncbi:protein UsfY [Mycobacterium sp.]|uniref:protein UsfY n=1 Tax=Mycobacterium sp. TaxID=1785 RepID=UPI0031D60FEF
MGDTHHDPTDRHRTTQPHAGITMKDNFLWPGFILFVVALAGMISTAAAAAYHHYEWLETTVLIAVLATVAGALWFVVELRRVAHIDAQLVNRPTPGRRSPADRG